MTSLNHTAYPRARESGLLPVWLCKIEKQPTACRSRNGHAPPGVRSTAAVPCPRPSRRVPAAPARPPNRRPSTDRGSAAPLPRPAPRRRRQAAAPASAQKLLARPVAAEKSPQRPREHPDHRLVHPRPLTQRLPPAPRPIPRRLGRQPAIFQRQVLQGADSPRFRRPRVPALVAGTSSAAEISPKRLAAPKKPPRSVSASRCMIRFRAL